MALTLMACYGSPCVRDPDGCSVPPQPDLSIPIVDAGIDMPAVDLGHLADAANADGEARD
jgi:hypothetical protein